VAEAICGKLNVLKDILGRIRDFFNGEWLE